MSTVPVRRLRCVVFADMAGYSALTSRDETGTHAMWMHFISVVLTPCALSHGGTIIRLLGDGVLLTFDSATAALEWAMKIQDTIRENRGGATRPYPGLSLRIGVHICEAIVQDGDIYGDGVNITKRLQEVTQPDGIIISEELYNAVHHSVEAEYRNLGFLTLKNIGSAVRAYEVGRRFAPPAIPRGDADRPSIAVLPLQNLGGDEEFKYFADGVVEDIIVSLASLRELVVVSRASALSFGAGTDPRDAGRALGVRYVLQGTLRRSPSRIRVSTALVDALSGETLFSERCEFEHSDLFEVQDRIVERVVSRIAPNVRASERARALRKPPDNFTAYDNTLKALDLMSHLDRGKYDEAMGYLEKAMAIDPDFAMPAAYAARWHCIYVGQGWAADREAAAARARDLASRAVHLDRQNALALAAYGHVKSYLERDYDSALIFLDRARDMGPSQALGWILSSATLCYVGRAEEAVSHAEYGLRLSPHDPDLFQYYDFICLGLYFSGRYEEAMSFARRSHAERANYTSNLRQLTVCASAIGDTQGARRYGQALLSVEPGFNIETYAAHCPFRHKEYRDRYLAHLEKAGLPLS
ncbi:adenylate/guanylate cyclase domain-containing protein [Oceanicella sp. SM1341]|uniref:adenylate/guanylate cyclase domain-containing protein n=1 Tax=Oceanicella sp. SM1341 TaxID=1548889 RepID=UPI0018E57201|nr:adenylate/guanylate cyclase domain-containing protein [Oceanicella sp. SM1341]